MAAWVRFADGKATLLAAGLAATLALLGGGLDNVTRALNMRCPENVIVGILGCLVLAAIAWTLYWLVAAINPRDTVTDAALNRFAWPTMARASIEELRTHVAETDVDQDAWKQAVDLAKIAEKKFGNTRKAAYGFTVTVGLGVALVTYSAVVVGV